MQPYNLAVLPDIYPMEVDVYPATYTSMFIIDLK